MTDTKIVLDLVDTLALDDAKVSPSEINEVSNLEDLKDKVTNYATLEKNTFILDGNQRILDEYIETGYSSEQVSEENCMFKIPITLTIDFEKYYHTSAGITLIFGEDGYCNYLNAKYYSDDILLVDKDYYPTSSNAYLDFNVIENYNKIELTFYSMNLPYRFLKIKEIIYGIIKEFTDDDLSSGSTSHEVSVLSSELPINTLSFALIDEISDFNIVNPRGYYLDMQENQKVSVYQTLQGKDKFIGSFYLTKWSNSSTSQAEFEAQDIIGVLDNYTFNGGLYTDKNSGELISEILNIANIETYKIEDGLDTLSITGLIKISTCREALQQVLFAIGGICNTFGEETLRIHKTQNEIVKSAIENERKILESTSVELNEKISGLQITMHNFSLDSTELKEISKGILDGTNKIEFNNPIQPSSIVATNCTVVEVDYNYAIITSSIDSEYILQAYEYVESKNVKTIQKVTKENLKENLATVDSYLINTNNITSIAERLFNFYNASYKTTVEVVGGNEVPSDCVSVNTFDNNRLIGNVSSISYDLTGGFFGTFEIDNARLKEGYDEAYFSGQIYSNEESIREVY